MRIWKYIRIPQKGKLVLPLLVLAAGAAASFAIVVQAQTPSAAEDTVTFPIAELGNCGSKEECRDYCNEPGNIPVCAKFAREHGLMNEEEAARAEKFSQRLSRGEGPGGCRTPRECKSFCSNIQNIEACVKFAEEHGVKDRQVEEGKKILAYIQAGGRMPGGCNSKESCEKYCGDFSHAEECFNFAERAGIVQVRETVPGEAEGRFEGGIPPGQFQKFLELIKRGETPGGCKSKEECENYCESAGHFEECIAFGEKAGFIGSEEARKMRAAGGKGPGGCNSEESCRAYCNDSAHQEECFRFAEEHGFIEKEEIERAKEGMLHLRAGLEQAPPEIAACLKSVLGPNIIEDIQSGNLTPGPEVGERVRQCQEKFGRRTGLGHVFSDVPPEVAACLKEKLGDSFEKARAGETQPTPEMADTLRVCFNQVRFMQGGIPGTTSGFAPGGQRTPPTGAFYDFLRSAPPGVAGCLEKSLGGDYARLKAGEIQAGDDLRNKVEKCFQEFRPQLQPFPHPTEKFPGGPTSVRPCPAMPTIDECPAGQEKFVIFKSEECGVYYGCRGGAVAAPPRPDGTMCIQVITPAQNPETGECRKFPTPCDVPQGWRRGCESAPPTGSQILNPVQLLQPFVAPLAPGTAVAPDSSFSCRSLEECAKYCYEAASPYYKTAECEKFRSANNVSP